MANTGNMDCRARSTKAQVRERNIPLVYNNKIPLEIVAAFEKHGFIWGGKWYRFDGYAFRIPARISRAEGDHGEMNGARANLAAL